MATKVQATRKRMKMAERAQQQLERHFPDFEPSWLWIRTANIGFTTLPRTLPLVMQAIDDQSKSGQPAGHTLFCLWARSPDHPLITIENPATFAAEAGYVGERAVNTWRRRMKQLVDLKLIMTKKGTSGDFHYVLLLNPNAAMEYMNECGLIQEGLYNRFRDRLDDIGAAGELSEIQSFWRTQREDLQATAEEAGGGSTGATAQKAVSDAAVKKTLAPKAPVRTGPAPALKKTKMPEPPVKKARKKS
ncbi:hypothetical protein [Herbaspirillum camelliae]|uniref:hypothetical protein n=1 Tax=Herbaspirillum camelliae TaxID=1892903 RepID=UPI000949EDB6|nr:hypothetical protein [Herbaspirillum camelliae]